MTINLLDAKIAVLNEKYNEVGALEVDINRMKLEPAKNADFIVEAEKWHRNLLGMIKILQVEIEMAGLRWSPES